MNRPYIICHMVTSLDGKVTGAFLGNPECAAACETYYEINRNLKSNGFICGRVTMEGSFTGGYYPDLSEYEPVRHDMDLKMDFILDDMTGFYAVAFDPKGKLGWKSNKIIDPDGDPGYDGAQIIEVLTEQTDERYLAYLESMEIPYIFAGETEIDVELALFKLKNIIGCDTLLLEGGSIVNGYFQRADVIDELSLVVAPVVADKNDKPLFTDSTLSGFEAVNAKIENGVTVLNYLKKIKELDEEQSLINKIDYTIKYIWENKIKEDYNNGWLLKEDTLKNAFYFHLRSILGDLLDKNDIRVFTEFTDEKFKGTGYRPDMVIAKVNFDSDDSYYGNYITDCLAVIEFKYKQGFNSSNDIYEDYKKLHKYVDNLKINCRLYMATIWEYEDDETCWESKNSQWASGKLTELNASYKRNSDEMKFYICEH